MKKFFKALGHKGMRRRQRPGGSRGAQKGCSKILEINQMVTLGALPAPPETAAILNF